jgi:hypothetical protein
VDTNQELVPILFAVYMSFLELPSALHVHELVIVPTIETGVITLQVLAVESNYVS